MANNEEEEESRLERRGVICTQLRHTQPNKYLTCNHTLPNIQQNTGSHSPSIGHTPQQQQQHHSAKFSSEYSRYHVHDRTRTAVHEPETQQSMGLLMLFVLDDACR